jgi:hypothetical protein
VEGLIPAFEQAAKQRALQEKPPLPADAAKYTGHYTVSFRQGCMTRFEAL